MGDDHNSSNDLQSLLDAIKSSDVVESRIQLLDRLGEIDISGKPDLLFVIECLTIAKHHSHMVTLYAFLVYFDDDTLTFWEDYTCLDATQCMLNKAILDVAAKHVESNISIYQSQFLTLGTKASSWCGKHLKMTLMSTEDSQEEEHSNLFFQLLRTLFSFSVDTFSALSRHSISVDEASMNIVEKFILEQLNLARDSISEVKRIQSHKSELLNAAQVVISAAVKLCGVYAEAVNMKQCDGKIERDKSYMDCEEVNNKSYVINVTKCVIEKLCELGTVAAKDGGSLVTILNLSWKGVVTLLQFGEGILGTKVNVADIILTLISFVNGSLRCAAEAWSVPLKEIISVTEARRIFLPVKFYLINAARISSLFPCQAYEIHKELTRCVLVISTFRISICNEELLKTAGDVLTELLEKTSFDLLNSFLCSTQVKHEFKSMILDYLFTSGSYENCIPRDVDNHSMINSIDEVFCVSSQVLPYERAVLLGRVVLLLSFLRYSVDFEEDMKVEITGKLNWFLDFIVREEIYSSVLVVQIPVLHGSGKAVELIWQPMFLAVLSALKTFTLVVYSSLAWVEMESFLIDNLFHPHFLCWEIVMELWCFVVRHAESEMVSRIIDNLCLLLKMLASSRSVLRPQSALRKLARSINMLLSFSTQSMVEQVYNLVVCDERSQLTSVIRLALFMEDFPLNLMSNKMRSVATQQILTDYFVFMQCFNEKAMTTCNNDIFGVPIFALSASLQSLQINLSDFDAKILKFLVSVIHTYRASDDKLIKDQCRKLLSETLIIISNMKHLYAYDEMEELIFELQNLFISDSMASNDELYQCKSDLARFMAGLVDVDLSTTGKGSKISAAWDLYHMLLKERHWVLIHLAISAFGYFSSRTTCNELWRFVPENAALSYDLVSGSEVDEERFMLEFKIFLEKEMALQTIKPNLEQLCLLAREGLILKNICQKISISTINVDNAMQESMKIDSEKQLLEDYVVKQSFKKRKLPSEISMGMELLQNGLKVISDGLYEWKQTVPDSSELQGKFLAHFSRIEDEISRLVGLTSGANR